MNSGIPREPTTPVEHADTAVAVSAQRDGWLAAVVQVLTRNLFAAGAWLVGSLGRGSGDSFSDIDLIVAVDATTPREVFADPVAGLHLPGPVLFTRPKPRNAPAGGAYLAICVELAGLPVLIDLYLWPTATAAVPVGGRVLYAGHTEPPRSDLEFMPLLDRHRTSDTGGADPDHPASVLFLVQLAAKYHARRDAQRRRVIHYQLQIPADAPPAVLRDVIALRVDLTRWPQYTAAVAAAHRLIDRADSPTEPRTPTAPDGPAPPQPDIGAAD